MRKKLSFLCGLDINVTYASTYDFFLFSAKHLKPSCLTLFYTHKLQVWVQMFTDLPTCPGYSEKFTIKFISLSYLTL